MPLGGVLFIGVFVFLFGCLLLLIASKLGKRSYDPVKLESYECGLPVQEKKDTKISVKFYLTAILFIIFDIEIIFMYPWAVNFKEMGLTGFLEMLVFLGLLALGFIYIIRKGALKWE